MPYGAPYGAPPVVVVKPGNPAFAVTGFVLSVLGFLIGLYRVIFGGPLTILGLIFSAIGMRFPRLRGLAIAGLVISIISLLLDILAIGFTAYLLTH